MDFVAKLKAQMASYDPETVAAIKGINDELLRWKTISPGTVHQNTTLSNVSVQYRNEAYIGEQLLPVVTVPKRSDIYYIYDKRGRFEGIDDQLGARSKANEIEETRSTDNYSVKNYGLQNYVDVDTLMNQDAPLNEMVDLVQAINDILALKREMRIATVLTTSGNFGSNTAAIGAGTAKWDDPANTSIIGDIQTAVSSLWTGAGPSRIVGYCSTEVWNVIARHAKILGLFNYVKDGLAMPKQVANYFGMDDILVGAARKDTANSGQTASYSRIWGKTFGVVRVANSPSIRNASFGYTFRLAGTPNTQEWFDPSVGLKGGYYAKVGVAEDYKVVASDTGFLYTACIA